MLEIKDLNGDWKNAMNNVVMCDCLDAMKLIPDKAIDLIICDPPYGIGKRFRGGNTGKMNFNTIVDKGWDNFAPTQEYFDEMFRISRNQIIWGGNYFNLPPSRCFLIWDKKQSENFSLAMCEMAWTSFDSNAKIFRQSVHSEQNKQHPTQKPVQLFSWLIEKYGKDANIILDPFAGSGTLGVAAKQHGKDFILFEKDTDYCEIIRKRLAQQTLF